MSTAVPWFNQCQINIVILVDGSNGLTSDQFDLQIAFIAYTLAASGWYHFDSIAFATYSRYSEFVAFSYGTFQNITDFQQLLNSQQVYYIGTRSNITGYLLHTLRIFICFALHLVRYIRQFNH